MRLGTRLRTALAGRYAVDGRVGGERGAALTGFLIALLVVLVVLLIVIFVIKWRCVLFGCTPPNPCPQPAEYSSLPDPPAVASLEIVPAELDLRAPPGSRVLLEVRARTEEGIEIPDVFAVDLEPITTGSLQAQQADGRSLVVTATGPGTVFVRRPSGTIQSGAVTVRFHQQAGTQVPADWPMIALADVVTGEGTQLADRPMAFLGALPLSGGWSWGGRWNSILFLNASGGPDLLEGNPGGGNPQPASMRRIDVPITAWFAVPSPPTCGSTVVSDHTSYATHAYERARAGLGFVATEVDLSPEPELVSAIDEFCAGVGNPPPPHDDRGAMNVYFHDGDATWGGVIDYPEGERAMACIPWNALTSTSVLAHELGHSLDLDDLSPRLPNSEPDPIAAMNVMSQHYTPMLLAPHSRLLPGQVFTALMSGKSWILLPWLGLVEWPPVQCPVDCPPQRLDVAATP